jgi:hypothetical protein
MKTRIQRYNLLVFLMAFLFSRNKNETDLNYNLDDLPIRQLIEEYILTFALDNLTVIEGRIVCLSNFHNARLSVLSHVLLEKPGEFSISLDIGLLTEGENKGLGWIALAFNDETDSDIKSVIYFGKGLKAAVSNVGFVILGIVKKPLPENFDYENFSIPLNGLPVRNLTAELSFLSEKEMRGIIQLVNNNRSNNLKKKVPKFWFDNLKMTGGKFSAVSENCFGPVLWTMYTLRDDKLKLNAQFPPVGPNENLEPTQSIGAKQLEID